MKKFLISCLTGICFSGFAQEGALKVGFRLAPGTNVATVKDNDGTPSGIRYTADGQTAKYENVAGVGASFFLDYYFKDNVGFSTGLWFTQKNFHISNRDGAYYGTSVYKTTYLQIPLLLKLRSNELFKNFRLYGTFGPTIDFKTGEKLDGPDYAHYWNMAQNNYVSYRERNASGRPVKLFNPIDFTLYLSVGANYEITDKLEVFAGLFFNKGFVNAVNPKLRFADPNQTKVNTDISIKSLLIGLEMGVTYRLK